ncbi:MAG: methyltransferase domain-containing protein [Nitrospirae bacterium]|nr:MAG: methyltransferase domain-containing protein [Nitrospirota bacterium]
MENNQITQAVRERYAKAVTTGEAMCCPSGYDFDELRTFIPDEVLQVSYGCGTPVGLTTVQPGETVLDIGSGGGIDCFEASRRVGPTGRVIGIDMTDEMLALARAQAPTVAKNLGYPQPNVEFRKGYADAMPVEDESVDLIISNCVINLAPDKLAVFREMYRVLRPGGRFTVSDIVADQPVPKYLIHDPVKWGDCLSGSLPIGDYWQGLRTAGFRGVHQVNAVPWRVIDGIHFFSITVAGYKCSSDSSPMEDAAHLSRYATLVGPFSQVVAEDGHQFVRGVPTAIDSRTAVLFQRECYRRHFLLTEDPCALSPDDPQWSAILPEPGPCLWKGDFAVFTGPFFEAMDDDDHVFRSGEPVEICSKTRNVLSHEGYRDGFLIFNRAGDRASVTEASCNSNGQCC